MTSFRINVPLNVAFGMEVNADITKERVAQLLAKPFAGGSFHPAADNFLKATRQLIREGAAWSLASEVDELDYQKAKEAIPEEVIRVTLHVE